MDIFRSFTACGWGNSYCGAGGNSEQKVFGNKPPTVCWNDVSACCHEPYAEILRSTPVDDNLKLPVAEGNGNAASSTATIRLEERPTIEIEGNAKYTGQWLGELRQGWGVVYRPDGGRYEGELVGNRANGKGRFKKANGDVYEGQWRDDKAHGQGSYSHADGSSYYGQWCDDMKNGVGPRSGPMVPGLRVSMNVERRTVAGFSDRQMVRPLKASSEMTPWKVQARIPTRTDACTPASGARIV